MINFSNASFVKSCLEEKDFPNLQTPQGTPLPEIAIIGRSNAGKSSLLNHLAQKKKLVFISSTPGKTQCLNFFIIDEKILLVDLPGYGFAKVNQTQKKTWSAALSHYLESRDSLITLILVLDLRRDLSPEDKQMIDWAILKQKKLIFVFSKHDKLTDTEKKKAEARLLESLTAFPVSFPISYLSYSIKDSQCRMFLKNKILSSLE